MEDHPKESNAYPQSQRGADLARMGRLLQAMPVELRREARHVLGIAWTMGWHDGWGDQQYGSMCVNPIAERLT